MKVQQAAVALMDVKLIHPGESHIANVWTFTMSGKDNTVVICSVYYARV